MKKQLALALLTVFSTSIMLAPSSKEKATAAAWLERLNQAHGGSDSRGNSPIQQAGENPLQNNSPKHTKKHGGTYTAVSNSSFGRR